MGLVQTTIPGLYNGVSQQPPTLRLENQCELQENALSLLVTGLMKRPNSDYVGNLGSLPSVTEDSLIHFIDRGDGIERYILIVTTDLNEPLKVFTLDGEPCTITYEGMSKNYLRNLTVPNTEVKCLSVADHTFIVNKNIKPTAIIKANTPSDEYPNSGVVFISRGLIETDYTVEILVGSSKYSSTHTTPKPDGELGNTMANTEDIAKTLAQDLSSKTPSSIIVTCEGSCIFVRDSSGQGNFGIKVRDSYGNQAMTVAKGTVQKFTDLPPVALKGTRVSIKGDDGSTRGTFYVKYKTVEEGSGYWEETYGEKDEDGNYMPNHLTPDYMPHRLVRIGPRQFRLRTIDWKDRLVGDEISAPLPSFVGRTINDIFFFKNRFGILSGDNAILSEVGEYYNFFPNTVTDVLDGDPIDVGVLTDRIVNLTHAVPLTSSLMLFSENQQFLLSGTGILTPVTVSVDINSYHKASEVVAPKSVGSSVFFISPKGAYSSLREFQVQPDITTGEADDITAHVPQYLPQNIKKIETSISTNTLFILPQTERDSLYVYSYYWEGEEKVQSSWGRWTFPRREIYNISVMDNWLYLVTRVIGSTNTIILERINLDVETLNPLKTQLDMLVQVKGVYNSATDKTEWTLPYSINECKLVDSETGLEFNKAEIQSSNKVVVSGNYGGTECLIGIPYEFKYRFSQWYLRDEYGVALTQGKLQIRNLMLSFLDTGYFKLRVMNGKRLHESEYVATPLGGLKLGQQSIQSGEKRFFIGGSSETVTIELTNDSYMPSRFQIASYEGFYTTRARR